MSEFIVSFKDVKLTAAQSTRVKTALKKAAKKALPIARQPGQPSPGKGGPIISGGGKGTGKGTGTGTGKGTGTGRQGTGKPIGKSPIPIVFPVSYRPKTRSWAR
jgi:hypothetical protein